MVLCIVKCGYCHSKGTLQQSGGEVWCGNLIGTVLLFHIKIQIIAQDSDIFRQTKVFFFIST